MHFLEWNVLYFYSNFKFVSNVPIDNKSALIRVVAWHWTGDKVLKHYLNQCWPSSLMHIHITKGLGSLNLCSLISPLWNFFILQKYCHENYVNLVWMPYLCMRGTSVLIIDYLLDTLNHINIWQMSPQLSCGDACQIWMWYSIDNQCFDNSKKNVKITKWRKFAW